MGEIQGGIVYKNSVRARAKIYSYRTGLVSWQPGVSKGPRGTARIYNSCRTKTGAGNSLSTGGKTTVGNVNGLFQCICAIPAAKI